MPPNSNKVCRAHRKNGQKHHSGVNGPGRPPPTMALALLSASLFCAFLVIVLPSTRGAKLEESMEPEDGIDTADWLLRTLGGGKIGRKMVESSSSESGSSSEEREAKRRRGARSAINKLSRFGDLLEDEEYEEDDHRHQNRATSIRRSHSAEGGNAEIQKTEGNDEGGQKTIERKFKVDALHPIHILFPLPTDEGRLNENPFGITILKAKPVVDEAVEEVYRRELVPPNSLRIHFEDSMLSDAHGPNVAINQLVDNQLDCIIGYAFVYALAPVARMSPFWRDKDSNGIPVITSVGLTSNLDNRREYQLMTRISSPYKVVKDAVMGFFNGMGWIRTAYLFHEQRYDASNPSIPYGECYLLMASVQPHLYRANRMEHNYFMFNELKYDYRRTDENLRKASALSNALCHSGKIFLPSTEGNCVNAQHRILPQDCYLLGPIWRCALNSLRCRRTQRHQLGPRLSPTCVLNGDGANSSSGLCNPTF